VPSIVGTAEAAPAGRLTAVDGRLEAVVVDRAGWAYATNRSRNRVEVLSLATGALAAPIPVGTAPLSLDLSVDERTLYVANADSHDISVVDVASRRELRRIPLPAGHSPLSIAVTARNTALVTSSGMHSIDLATETAQARTDWPRGGSIVRASGDRSRVGVVQGAVSSSGSIAAYSVYDASTDRFAPVRFRPGASPILGVDNTGSTILAGPDTLVLDRNLVVRGTIPGPESRAIAVSPSGTTAYRLQTTTIEVITVGRALVTASITLPDGVNLYEGGLAVTRDNTTLVALTMGGISVVPVAAAAPVPCSPPAVPSGTVPVCGAPLADVVVDGRGWAYASNPARNQIEVVSLANNQLGAPIPIGSQPRGIGLAPDRNTMYVVNSGAEDISVVDLTLRREVGRITVASREGADRPLSVAVADNGLVFLTTRPLFSTTAARLLQIERATGAVSERDDYPGAQPPWATVGRPMYLQASGDGSAVVGLAGTNGGGVFVYTAETNTFGPSRQVTSPLTWAAVDADGSKLAVGSGIVDPYNAFDPGTHVLDRDLVRRATIPSFGADAMMNFSGTRVYELSGRDVEILDIGRGLISARIRLPEYGAAAVPGAIAVTPDEATVVALTASGISIAAVNTAVPTSCPPPTVSGSLVALCGAPLGEMAIDRNGTLFASNPERNQIEVVSLATGAVEPAIPVGSRPRGIDLSPDGSTLYVANSGAQEISVVDVAQRRELRRITVPSGDADRPFSIAVGDHGIALFSATSGGFGYSGRLYELDLVDETVSSRSDFGHFGGTTVKETLVRASGDRSKIAVAHTNSTGGEMSLYTAASDTFSAPENLYHVISSLSVNGTGSRMLLGPGALVVNDQLDKEGAIPSAGKGVAINRPGTTGYRAQDSVVEILNLDTRVVTASVPLPEQVGTASGAVAVSPDEETLAVLTARGISLVGPNAPAPSVTPQSAISVWSQPKTTPLDGFGAWTAVVNDPVAGAGQTSPAYFYGHYFSFATSRPSGMVGLATGPTGKLAMFTVMTPDGNRQSAAVPFDWKAGGFYFSFVYRTAPDTWGAWILDHATNAWTSIGELKVPVGSGKLAPFTASMAMWHGGLASNCAAYPRADVVFSPTVGYIGLGATMATLAGSDHTPGECPAAITVGTGSWVSHRLGTNAPS
jgi:YVTN family beta-propeller protein